MPKKGSDRREKKGVMGSDAPTASKALLGSTRAPAYGTAASDPPAASPARPSSYRPDIDGLRAVAVGIVIPWGVWRASRTADRSAEM